MWLGELAALEMEQLSGHLENCPTCLAAVQTLQSHDTFLEGLRSHVAPARQPELAAAEDVIARLRKLPGSVAAEDYATCADAGADCSPPQDLAQTFAAEALDFLTPPQTPAELGRLGSYRVLKLLGQGGMGLVFEAEDVLLQRSVAVKIMHPHLAREANAQERFLREARAAAALKHEHVVTIFQVGMEKDVPYLVMEFLAGDSLADRLKREPALSMSETVRIGREIAAGLAGAHHKGLIHRDIKPSNIWLQTPEGRVRILDFGLARPVTSDVRLTQSGAILGTPAYMAPEQAAGESIDARADLFSLGCVLYQMTTGRLPFAGPSVMAVLQKLAVENPRPPAEINPSVPAPLSDLIVRLLAKDPAQRPASAQAVVDELGTLERSKVCEATPEATASLSAPAPSSPASAQSTKAVSASRPASRHRRLLAAAAVLAVVLLPLAYLFAPTVIRIATNKGELVIETDDREVEVTVKHQGKEPLVLLLDRKKQRQIELRAGDYDIEVREKPDGFRFFTKKLTLSRGGTEIVNVQLELASAKKNKDGPKEKPGEKVAVKPPIPEAWYKLVAGLRPETQVQAVAAKLKERNSGFDGKLLRHNIEQGKVTELGFHTDEVTDISPVRALTALRTLSCLGSGAVERNGKRVGLGKLVDLSPLQGMALTTLDCRHTQVVDLSPLKNMPLTILAINTTPVEDLSPLRGVQQLVSLDLASTQVKDLSPLQGMKLTSVNLIDMAIDNLSPLKDMPLISLDCRRTKVSDLSPLKNMPLTILGCDFHAERDTRVLRSIKTLEKINGRAAAEFRREVEQRVLWQPGPDKDALPGIVPRPAVIAGIKRWQVETVSPRGLTTAADLHPNGKLIACASTEGAVRVYDVDSGELRLLVGHKNGAGDLKWSPDGNWLATTGGDGAYSSSLRLWRSDGILERIMRAESVHQFVSVAWSPDSKRLVSLDGGGVLRLWHRATGQQGTVIETGASQGILCWSPDGTRIALGHNNGMVRLYNSRNAELLEEYKALNNGGHLCLAWSPDGKWLGSAGADGVTLWNVAERKPGPRPPGLKQVTSSLVWRSNSKHLSWLERDVPEVGIRARIWELGAANIDLTLNAAGRLFWSRDGTRIVGAWDQWGVGSVWFWEAADWQNFPIHETRPRTSASDSSIPSISWSPDGTRFVYGGFGKAVLRDVATARTVASWPANGRFAWSPDGKWIAFDPADHGHLQLWDVAAQKLGRQLSNEDAPGYRTAAWSPDSTLLALAGKGKVRLFRMPKGEPLPDLKVDVEQVSHVAWSADGKWLAAAANDKTVHLFQMPEGKPASMVKTRFDLALGLEHNPGWLSWLQWNRTGRLALCEQAAIEIWTGPTLDKSQLLPCPRGPRGVAWSPEGKYLATAQSYGPPLLFDVATGKPAPDCKEVGVCPATIAWSPDGRYLAGQTADISTVTLWDMSTRQPAQVNVLLPGAKVATFSAAGNLLSTDADLDRELIYLVEDNDGKRRLLKPKEFRALVEKNPPRPAERDPDREAALWALGLRLKQVPPQAVMVTIAVNGQEREVESCVDLPAEPFKVVALRCGSLPDGDQILETIAGFGLQGLKSIYFENVVVTDPGLSHLQGLQGLRSLTICCYYIPQPRSPVRNLTDAGIEHLLDLTQLEFLHLHGVGVSDASLERLSKALPKLKVLYVSGPGITDAGVERLLALKSLTELHLDDTRTSAATVGRLTRLTGLGFSGRHVRDDELDHLATLTQLRVLLLDHTAISGSGLKSLKGLTNLEQVGLHDTNVNDDALATLKEFPGLGNIALGRTRVTDNGLVHLGQMARLSSLNLGGEAAVTDAGLQHLKQAKNLRGLVVSGTKVTAAGVAELQKALPGCKIEWDGAKRP